VKSAGDDGSLDLLGSKAERKKLLPCDDAVLRALKAPNRWMLKPLPPDMGQKLQSLEFAPRPAPKS
jgi:hypothetical protein